MKNYINDPHMSIGFGMELAQDLSAMNYFDSLTKEQQQQVMNHAHQIKTKEEMEAYVNFLV